MELFTKTLGWIGKKVDTGVAFVGTQLEKAGSKANENYVVKSIVTQTTDQLVSAAEVGSEFADKLNEKLTSFVERNKVELATMQKERQHKREVRRAEAARKHVEKVSIDTESGEIKNVEVIIHPAP